MPVYFHLVYDCFCAPVAEFSSCDRDREPSKPKIFTRPSQKMFADLCSVLFLQAFTSLICVNDLFVVIHGSESSYIKSDKLLS